MRLTITVDIDEHGKAVIDVQSDEAKPKKLTGRHQTEHQCQQCGTKYMRYRSDSNFCSKKCYQQYYNIHRGRVKKLPPNHEVIRPNPFFVEFKPQVPDVVVMKKPKATGSEFVDRWDCQRCRDYQKTCDLHAKLEVEGKTPPLYPSSYRV